MTAPTGVTTAAQGSSEQRVVVGVDGSECGFRALEFAADEAELRDAVLHVVSAYEASPSVAAWPVVPLEPDQEHAAAVVDTSLERVQEGHPALVCKGEIRYGVAGRILIEASDGASLLVVGTHGRGPVSNLLLGSVAGFCVRHATIPLTVVH